jgi:hypothetical protein
MSEVKHTQELINELRKKVALYKIAPSDWSYLMNSAADTLDQLREENEQWRKACEALIESNTSQEQEDALSRIEALVSPAPAEREA